MWKLQREAGAESTELDRRHSASTEAMEASLRLAWAGCPHTSQASCNLTRCRPGSARIFHLVVLPFLIASSLGAFQPKSIKVLRTVQEHLGQNAVTGPSPAASGGGGGGGWGAVVSCVWKRHGCGGHPACPCHTQEWVLLPKGSWWIGGVGLSWVK